MRRKRKTNAQMISSSMRTANFPCNCPLLAISLKHLKSRGKCNISTCRVTLPWCNDSDRYRVYLDNVGHSYSKTPINKTIREKEARKIDEHGKSVIGVPVKFKH